MSTGSPVEKSPDLDLSLALFECCEEPGKKCELSVQTRRLVHELGDIRDLEKRTDAAYML